MGLHAEFMSVCSLSCNEGEKSIQFNLQNFEDINRAAIAQIHSQVTVLLASPLSKATIMFKLTNPENILVGIYEEIDSVHQYAVEKAIPNNNQENENNSKEYVQNKRV